MHNFITVDIKLFTNQDLKKCKTYLVFFFKPPPRNFMQEEEFLVISAQRLQNPVTGRTTHAKSFFAYYV